jgi:hypothetical protein
MAGLPGGTEPAAFGGGLLSPEGPCWGDGAFGGRFSKGLTEPSGLT